jgi:hypothetical protein
LVEEILPDVPIRQFVLSPPFDLRGLLASKSEVLSKMATLFARAIFRRLKRWAKTEGLSHAECGSITFIQRFTKTLSIAPHLHLIVLDGVFVNGDEAEPMRFIDAPPPTEQELLVIAQDVCEKMIRYLKKKGYLEEDTADAMTATERWFLRGLAEPSGLMPTRMAPTGSGVEFRGFSVHAGVTVARGNKRGREQLCRYVARPPFAEEQFRMKPDGRVELTLRSPARNGQSCITLEPLQLMRRLAWLVPPPGRHQVSYAGILAPAAKHRLLVVPRSPPSIQLAFPLENMRPERLSFRPSWAQLLARVYSIDAERCPGCGDRLRPIGAVTDPIEAERHLARLERARAQDPPQRRFLF